MNTITVQLTELQYTRLEALVEFGERYLRLTGQDPTPEDKVNDLLEALASTKRYLWSDSYGFNDLEVPAEVVDAVAQSGANEPACRAALEEHGFLRRQLEELDMAKARTYLSEAGIDQVEKKGDAEVRLYMLRMACHDISEERSQED